MARLLVVVCLLMQFLFINSVFASNQQSFGVVGVKYREPELKIYADPSKEVVKSTLEYTLLQEVSANKVEFIDIGEYVQKIKNEAGDIELDSKEIPKLLEKLEDTKIDYYIVGYINSVGVRSANSSAFVPFTPVGIMNMEGNGSTVQVDLSISIYSRNSKKVVFVATGRGESGRNQVNVGGTTMPQISFGGKFAMEQQFHNALQKATIVAAQKIAKAF